MDILAVMMRIIANFPHPRLVVGGNPAGEGGRGRRRGTKRPVRRHPPMERIIERH